MYKVMLVNRRKDGVTREEWRRGYEEQSVPLVRKALPQLRRYVRNYVVQSPDWDPGFDVITELWFDNEQDWQDVLAFVGTPEGQAIIRVEEAFMDVPAERILIVEEEGA